MVAIQLALFWISEYRAHFLQNTSIVKTAISIGNFDAVHIGHVALVRAAREAVGNEGKVILLSFDPLPVAILRPDIKIGRITSFKQRQGLLLEAGADEVHQITPNKELLNTTPEVFIQDIVRTYVPTVIVEGSGFRFGKGRSGNFTTLQSLGEMHGFACIEIDGIEIKLDKKELFRASSSVIRALLEDGAVANAAMVLGRSYSIEGTVVEGDKRGRTLGFPTANLVDVSSMLPRNGIYAGVTEIQGETYSCAISIGTKPTFGKHERVCEVHIIGFDGEIGRYDWFLRVTMAHWIRDQKKFESVDALKTAIQQDIQQVITLTESNS